MIDETGSTIEKYLKSLKYTYTYRRLSKNDDEPLKKAKKNTKKLNYNIEDLRNSLFYFIRNWRINQFQQVLLYYSFRSFT